MKNYCCRKGIVVGIIILFFGVGIAPILGISNSIDDTTPPVTTISFDPEYPDGNYGWYIRDVYVTLNATDDISGVKTIYYKIPGDDWKNHSGDSIKILLDNDCLMGLIEYYSVDYAGNQEETKSINIDIDQLPPYVQLWYEIMDGNPDDGWIICVTINIVDNCSGFTGKSEIYLNGILQEIIQGPGPTYYWSFVYWGGIEIQLGVSYCDWAGNCGYSEIPIKSSRNNIQQSIHPVILRFLERFPIIMEVLLRLINPLR